MPHGATNNNTGTTSRTIVYCTLHRLKFALVYYRELSLKSTIISLAKGNQVPDPDEKKNSGFHQNHDNHLAQWEITTHLSDRPGFPLVVVFTCWQLSTINSLVLIPSHLQWGCAHLFKTPIKTSSSWRI